MFVVFYSNPVISSTSLAEKMSGRKFLRLPVIKKSLGLGGDVEGDWATIAVLVSKIPPKTSSKVNGTVSFCFD